MPRGHFKENRFQFLLLALLLQFALGGWFPKEHNDFIHAAAMVGWLAAAIYALRLERRHLIAVVAAGLVVVGLMFIRGAEPVEDAAAFFVLCALGAGVLRHILRAKIYALTAILGTGNMTQRRMAAPSLVHGA